MSVTVLVGNDSVKIRSRRCELLAGSGAEPASVARYDLAVAEEVAAFMSALTTLPLFAGPRYLEASPVAALDEHTATLLGKAAACDTIVLYGDKAPAAAAAKRLGGTQETWTAPVGADRHARVREIAAEHGVTLSAAQVGHIVDRCNGDPARVTSLMYSLVVTGLTAPSQQHLDRLLAGANPAAAGTPWALTDLLAAGRTAEALTVADTLEPVAAWSYIATRVGQLGRALESGYSKPEEVAGAIGLASLTAARNLLALAERIGPAGIAASWDLIARTDVALKASTHPHPVLDLALLRLAQIWTRPSGGDSLPVRR